MATTVYQRYLLQASTTSTNAAAGAPWGGTAQTAHVPLGARWTIRMRWVTGQAISGDASGQLSVQRIATFWQLFNAQNQALFTLVGGNSFLNPPFTMPAIVTSADHGLDFMQTISSLDQIGGTATYVVAFCQAQGTNLDATNPHPFTVAVNAILEFEGVGSSE